MSKVFIYTSKGQVKFLDIAAPSQVHSELCLSGWKRGAMLDAQTTLQYISDIILSGLSDREKLESIGEVLHES